MFLPLLLGAAGIYLLVTAMNSKPAAATSDGSAPSPLWSGRVIPNDFGGVSVNVFDDAARVGILRAMLRNEIVAADAKTGPGLWSAGLRHGVGGLSMTDANRGKYTAEYVDPAKRGLQFIAQALQAGKDVYAPVEWAVGDVRVPLKIDADRSADLYASDKPLDPVTAKYWARLLDAPRDAASMEMGRAALQSMLTAPGKDFEVGLLTKKA